MRIFAEFIDIQKSDAARSGGFTRIDQQLVFHERAVAATASLQLFELFEPLQMRADLELAPTARLADFATGEVALALIEGILVHHGADAGFDVLQELAGLGRDFIEAAAEDLGGEAVGGGKIAINLRGLEYLQTHLGEDDETSWKRLRPKLSYTGRQLDEVYLMLPSAVPSTSGSSQTQSASSMDGTLFGDETQTQNPPNTLNDPVVGGIGQQPSTIFGTGASAGASRPRIPLSNPPTSSLNLIGKLESWGIGPATQVAEVAIKISAATGAQLKELLKKLPDGMTFELQLEKEEN